MKVVPGGKSEQEPEELCTGCGQQLSNPYYELILIGSEGRILICTACDEETENLGLLK